MLKELNCITELEEVKFCVKEVFLLIDLFKKPIIDFKKFYSIINQQVKILLFESLIF